MIDCNGQILHQFLLDGGTIETIFVSNKTTVLEKDTYTSDNTDADEFYQNIIDYVEFLASNHPNVTCILMKHQPNWDHKDFMRISPS